MKATILDTVTGQKKVVDGPRSWEWAENNWSCDCNRNPWGVETGGTDNVCEGCKRFLVVEAVMDDPTDYEYTLDELNDGYPAELRARFLETNAYQMLMIAAHMATGKTLDELLLQKWESKGFTQDKQK